MDGRAGCVRRTAVDGVEVRWHVLDGAVRVESIAESGGRVLRSYAGPEYPDLAEVRDLWPRLAVLWDVVAPGTSSQERAGRDCPGSD